MCPVRKRAKSILQHQANIRMPLLSAVRFGNQIVQAVQQEQKVEKIQFDASYLFSKKQNPFAPSYAQLWTKHQITMLPYLQIHRIYRAKQGKSTNSTCKTSTEPQKSQIHTLELQNENQTQQNMFSDVKTTISMEFQGSTFGCQNSMQEILSISNSVISCNSMQI